MEKILLKNIENPNSADIKEYINAGGYRNIPKALGMEQKEIIEEVRKSGLRGRGGAGFPTGMKWMFASADPKFPKYLICNADEGEPGTFKDRPILEKNPHLLIEGMVISAYALKSEYGYIYLRGEYPHAKNILNKAIKQAYEKGYLGENILGKGIKFHLSATCAHATASRRALARQCRSRSGWRSRPSTPMPNTRSCARIPRPARRSCS